MRRQTSWRSYEEVAQYLLDQMARHFGLGSVEGKQREQVQSGKSTPKGSRRMMRDAL